MSDPQSKSRIVLQWTLEGLFVVWVLYLIIMWAYPELREAHHTIVVILCATFFVYEFGRWLADRFVGDDDD